MIQQTEQCRKKSFCTKFSSLKAFLLVFCSHTRDTKKNSNKSSAEALKRNSKKNKKAKQKTQTQKLCRKFIWSRRNEMKINRDLLELQLGFWKFSSSSFIDFYIESRIHMTSCAKPSRVFKEAKKTWNLCQNHFSLSQKKLFHLENRGQKSN